MIFQRQHELEILNLKAEQTVKITELEDKINKIQKEIQVEKKNTAILNTELDELKVKDSLNKE